MKSVLISIRPQWCEKIANGEKTIEVRKTAPKEVLFKCYIYETQGITGTPWIDEDGHFIYKGRGQVIGEFICDKVDKWKYLPDCYSEDKDEKMYYISSADGAAACLTYDEVKNYGKGKTIYGWHISDLKIYDNPKELSEFRKSGFMTEEEWLFNLYPNTHCHYDAWAKKFEITRPPQSWCYVEELEK